MTRHHNHVHSVRYDTECGDCNAEITTVMQQGMGKHGAWIKCSCGRINWTKNKTPLNEDGGFEGVFS